MLEQATRRRTLSKDLHLLGGLCHDLQQLWRFGWNSAFDICCSLRASPGRENALTKRNLIVAAFTLTVLAVAGCGGSDGVVKPTATRSALSPMTSPPTSSPTPTIDPKAQPAIDAYLAYMTAS